MNAPDDLQLLEELIAAAPVEVRKRLAAKYCSPGALRDHRLAERDASYRGLAAYSAAGSGYATAMAVIAELELYSSDRGAWRFDRDRAPPADPRRAFAHQILTLDGGRVRSRSTVERALAGVRSNSPAQMNGRLPHASAPDDAGERNARAKAAAGDHRTRSG